MKKVFAVALATFLILFCTVSVAVSACESNDSMSENHIDINLDEMEVGEVVVVGGIAFEKAPYDASAGSGARETTEGFTVSNFGGNKSMNKVLALNSTYRYFRILLNNEGTGSIKVDIGGKYTTSISPGSMYIYS